MRATLTASLLLFGLLFPSLHAAELGVRPYEYNSLQAAYVPNQLMVAWQSPFSETEAAALQEDLGVTILRQMPVSGVTLLQLPEGLTVPEALEKLRQRGSVAYAEPNFTARAAFVPDDAFYEYQWNLGQGSAKGINLSRSWGMSTGEGVTVAVIDTGIAYEDHQDFERAPDLADTNFVAGYDFVNGDAHPNDDQGHGTHVAGTIAQSTNNALGAAGIAFDAALMPIKALDEAGEGNHFDIASGIYYAVRNGAHIINMSLGTPSGSRTLKQSVAYAYQKGVLLVAAAGNEYRSGNPLNYPAAYDDYCLAVGATGYDDARAYYSNTGAHIDLSAPGGNLRQDEDKNGYGDGILQQTFGDSPTDFGYYFMEGTSMAAPHVSAVAALLMANGTRSLGDVWEALIETACDQGTEGHDPETGWGVVDAWAALNYSPIADDGPTDSTPTGNEVIIEEEEEPVPKLRVADLELVVIPYVLSSQVRAAVTVTDTDGQVVSGVTVTGVWTGLVRKTVALLTNSSGQAISFSGRLYGFGDIGFRVTDLRKSGWVYDDSLNAHIEQNILLEEPELLPPEHTRVGANYPNPFNPETWIPFQLSEAVDVEVTIYDLSGQVIRRLDLGRREAGEYHTPARAVYWDGRSTNGHTVSSGVYFYQFRAGEFVFTGKMVLRS